MLRKIDGKLFLGGMKLLTLGAILETDTETLRQGVSSRDQNSFNIIKNRILLWSRKFVSRFLYKNPFKQTKRMIR
jgi:hypothetical protein